MSADAPFTIIDGVPRPLLVEALKSAARDLANGAQRELSKKAGALARYCETPGGASGLARPERLEELLKAYTDARDFYVAKLAIAERTWAQAEELTAEEEGTP